MSPCRHISISFDWIHRSGIAGLYGDSFFKKVPNGFPKWLYRFHVPAVSTLAAAAVSSPALDLSVLCNRANGRISLWFRRVCFSVTANGAEHFSKH